MTAPRLRILESGIALAPAPGEEANSLNNTFGLTASSVHVFVNIEVKGYGIATGRASAPVRDPGDKGLMHALARTSAAYVCFRTWDTAFGHHLEKMNRSCKPEVARDIDAVDVEFGCHLFDAAVLDALLRASGLDFSGAMTRNISGIDDRLAPGATKQDIGTFLADGRSISRSALPGPHLAEAVVGLPRENQSSTAGSGLRWLGNKALWPPVATGKISHSGDRYTVWLQGVYGALAQAYNPSAANHALPERHIPALLDALTFMQNLALNAFLAPGRTNGCGFDPSYATILRGPGFASYGLAVPAHLQWL